MSKREQEDLLKIIAQKENPDANGSGDNSGSQSAQTDGASGKEDSDAILDTLMEVVEPAEFIEPIPVEEAPIRPLAGKPAPKPAPAAKPSPATGSAGATGASGANAANPKPAAKPNNSSGDDMETVDISFFN